MSDVRKATADDVYRAVYRCAACDGTGSVARSISKACRTCVAWEPTGIRDMAQRGDCDVHGIERDFDDTCSWWEWTDHQKAEAHPMDMHEDEGDTSAP